MENVNAQVEVITPEIAREYLKFNKVNRSLNKITVDYYADQMKRNQWMMNREAICFAKGGLLVNGQHRLNAIIKAGVPVSILVVRGVPDNSFITYDNGRNRTMGDVLSLVDVPNANNVATIIKKYLLMRQGKIIVRSSSNVASSKIYKVTKQDMMECYNSDSGFILKITRFSMQCMSKINIMTSSEIGAIYMFLVKEKKHPTEFVESFFRMLFYNENVSNSTINLFREKVIQSKLQASLKMSSKYKEALFIKTWNSYVSNKELKVLSWNEAREGKLELL